MGILTNLKNEDRKDAERIFTLEETIKALTEERDALKAKVIQSIETYGDDYKVENKTTYRVATLQRKGEKVYLVYKLTMAQGTVDYKRMIKELNIPEEVVNKYRRADRTQRTIAEATEKQVQELKGLGL